MHRFFVPADAIKDGKVTLREAQAHQAINVLRMGVGSCFQVLDNSGWQFEAEVISIASGNTVVANLGRRSLVDTEPRTKITLFQGLLKAAKFEIVLQKCTELGAVGFIPIITARSIVGNIGDIGESKIERWRRIVVEAAEQSGRGRLPTLKGAMMFEQACEQARAVSLLAWEGEQSRTIGEALDSAMTKAAAQTRGSKGRPFSVNLFLGPEGGFTESEVELAASYGIISVSLGKRILRAETAAITATALVLYESGDLDR